MLALPPLRLTPAATRLAFIAALPLLVLLAPLTAQAQSGYTLTTLNGPSSTDANLDIDVKNRVLGTLTLIAGFRSDPALGGLPGPYYENYMGQWAQPFLGTSVSATKISTKTGYLSCSSPDGNKLVSSAAGLLDRATNKFQALPSTIGYAADVNNAGMVVGSYTVNPPPGAPTGTNYAEAYRRAVAWTPGQTAVTLATNGSFVGASAYAVNNAGVIVGAVYGVNSSLNNRAARWVNGQLEVLENEPGKGSAAIDISNNGHVLLVGWDTQIVPVPLPDGSIYERVDRINGSYGVISNGSYTPIVSNVPGYKVFNATSVNASGTVIGTLTPDLTVDPTLRTRRAYLWKDGVMSDLTTWVTAKGVKLPAGAVLYNVVALNDQGSLVATHVDPKNANRVVYIRLQAKP